MNEKTSYEQLITEKLQHLPLPAMEDAIWAKIKTQLDLDLPTDDGGDPAPDAPAGGGWIWSAGVAIFVAALITTFLLFKKDIPPQPPVPAERIQNNQPLTPASGNQQGNDPPASGQVSNGRPVPNSSPGENPNSVVTTPIDSIAGFPTVNLPQPDTLQSTVLTVPPPVMPDTLPKKKRRGVTGITDDDYRIVPSRKDSL